jgi:hypothetical protein
MKLSREAEKEIRELSQSAKLRSDMAAVSAGRINPFIAGGRVNLDLYIEFLTQFNEYMGHPVKPFRPMAEREMIL